MFQSLDCLPIQQKFLVWCLFVPLLLHIRANNTFIYTCMCNHKQHFAGLQRAYSFGGIGNQAQSHHQMQTQTHCFHFSQVLASIPLPLLLLIPPANYCTPHKVTHQIFEYFLTLFHPIPLLLPFLDSHSRWPWGKKLKIPPTYLEAL